MSSTYAQKKSNGIIYSKHPAIDTVIGMMKAYVAGDSNKVAGYLTNDFKAINGLSASDSNKTLDKAGFSKSAKVWYDNFEDFSIVPSEGSYPDALEYKDDNQKNVVWVLTWEVIKGVNKKTGVKVEIPMHRMFIVTKDNKIKTIVTYLSSVVDEEIGQGIYNTNTGLIYNAD